MKKDEKFIYLDSSNKEHTIDITPEDFEEVNKNEKIHDQKFQSKPTTFFKDAMKRFVKNRSSVVGGVIIGVIVLLAFLVPLIDSSDITSAHLNETFLEPKLFNSGTGWWDGTKYYSSNVTYDQTNETPAGYVKSAVSELVTFDSKTNNSNKYAFGGDLRFNVDKVLSTDIALDSKIVYFESYKYDYDLSNDYTFTYTTNNTDTNDEYQNGKYRTYIKFTDSKDSTDYKYVYFNDFNTNYGETIINVTEKIKAEYPALSDAYNATVGFNLYPSYDSSQQVLINNVAIASNNTSEADALSGRSFSDSNALLLITKVDATTKADNIGYWRSNGNRFLYNADIKYCHFRYDSYEAAFGTKAVTLSKAEINDYIKKGYCKYDFVTGITSFESLSDDCPILEVTEQKVATGVVTTYSVVANVTFYKYLGYKTMPKYIFGTSDIGKDMAKLIFNGLRTSLLLGIVTSVINLCFGLIWGSISGYFGGWVDIGMERFTDILGRVPWIVVMTLCILYLGQNILTFGIALCLTGWMGTASTTRAQFYRFKGREYVLASRTLGASDVRLIFKHILPNSLGTLVTSSVFMVTSVIYTESTLAYLNLGIQGIDSFGVILSDNQQYISSNSYLILIPSVIMALMMISFNLFGNGLRDAFNPSLKGSE